MVFTQTEIPFIVDFDGAVKKLRIDEDYVDEYRDVFDDCMKIAKPVFVYAECPVSVKDDHTEIGGESFISKVMQVNFKEMKRAFPYVVSCGRALYDMAQKESDPLTRFWIEGTAEQVMVSALGLSMNKLEKTYGIKHYSTMNPGSLPDFPIINQRGLFRLLEGECEKAGVTLTESCLMLPNKSVSGILYETDEHYTNCSLCTRDMCPNRREPFDEKKYREKYGL